MHGRPARHRPPWSRAGLPRSGARPLGRPARHATAGPPSARPRAGRPALMRPDAWPTRSERGRSGVLDRRSDAELLQAPRLHRGDRAGAHGPRAGPAHRGPGGLPMSANDPAIPFAEALRAELVSAIGRRSPRPRPRRLLLVAAAALLAVV